MNDFEKQVLDDLSTLRTQMYSLVGNGQPGIVSKHNDRLVNLETFRDRVLGVFIFIIALATVAGAMAVLK